MNIDPGTYFAALAFLIPILILATNWFIEYTGLKSNRRRREEANSSFDKVVEDLASDNPAAQLSAAVLMRRFLTLRIGRSKPLYHEAINVISSILRTLPTGIYQKTLADSLVYAVDLTNADLQRTNLQDAYLGLKNETVKLVSTDLFMANLTYALIDNIDGRGAVFYNAHLYGATIKNSDFSGANFAGADLTNVTFDNVILTGAKFKKAINMPKAIADSLTDDGLCTLTGSYSSAKAEARRPTVFFSMPGSMSKSDEVMVKAYRRHLTDLGFEVIYYTHDGYPRFGQLSHIKAAIKRSTSMIAFGTCQTLIGSGTYRPGMSGERDLSDTWLSTPWNDVEVGMATMAGMPILLVKDDRIADGIFDTVISEKFMFTIPASTDISELDRNLQFAAWLHKASV